MNKELYNLLAKKSGQEQSKESYSDKLKNPKWQKLRLKVFERDSWKCVECKSDDKTLHVHHKKYSPGNPWDTPMEHLETLCSDCHAFNHTFVTVKIESYGTEGCLPSDPSECMYYILNNCVTSCISGSGGTCCAGFWGVDLDTKTVTCAGKTMVKKY